MTQPKTIADLIFNWTFDYNYEDNVIEKIRKDNPNICDLKIVVSKYCFSIDHHNFQIPDLSPSYVNDVKTLLREIDYEIFKLQNLNKLPKVLVLDHFEVISENEFRIHVKE